MQKGGKENRNHNKGKVKFKDNEDLGRSEIG